MLYVAPEVRVHLRDLQEDLRRLGLSSYESAAYLSLAASEGALTADEVVKDAKKLGIKLPDTKVRSVLKVLENRGIASREGYPHQYSLRESHKSSVGRIATTYLRDQEGIFNRVREQAQSAKQRLEGMLPELFMEGQRNLRSVAAVDAGNAQEITFGMWKRAKKELLVMTNSGDWIMKNDELRDTLKAKREQRPRVEIYALLGEKDSIPREKRSANTNLREYLSDIRAHVRAYEPRAMRMNVVDGREVEFFLWPEGKADSSHPASIYYSGNELVAREFRDFFFLRYRMRPPKLS